MSSRLSKIGALALTFATLAGCSAQSNSGHSGSLNAASILTDKATTPAQKAQRLADTSEQLMSLQGFDYANDVADLALEQDSSNVKAQFVKVVLGPIMAQRGIIARVAPLAALDARGQDQYSDALAQLDEKPDSTLKTFLMDGQGDIKTESDVQDQLDKVADAFGKIREFAKANKGATIVMNGTDELIQALTARQQQLCTVTYSGDYDYQYTCPSEVKMLQTTIDRGDFEVIQQYAAGMQLYLSLYNSYDLTGAIKVGQDVAAKKGQVVSPKDLVDQLLANPKFATLRAGNGFSKVKSLGADAITGVRWIMANQSKLCPMGVEDPHNRIGALVNNGICVTGVTASKANQVVRKVEATLNGALLPVTLQTAGGPTQTTLNPSALLDSPIADLRSIGPVTYSPCGKVSSVTDASLGGLFPQRDVNFFLSQDSQKCH